MTGSRKPLIGVTTYLEPASWGIWVREAALLPVSYLRSVERAGGVPVMLPPLESLTGIDGLVAALDGIIIAGGPDVDPVLYGAEPHEATGSPHPRRDRFELGLVRAVIEADLPFLAICRGMQLLNVARGGQLIQHLPDVVAHDGHRPNPGRFAKHRVQISVASTIGKILGEVADVPTYHHQGVQRLGKGLVAVAWAKDQVVEALELQGHRFGLAVQ